MKCEFCKSENTIMFDGKTNRGPWAIMCAFHFKVFGIGLGTGLGQKFRYSGASRTWKKIAG